MEGAAQLKILLVAYDAHPCPGGVDTYLRTLIDAFKKKGHEIDLISYSDHRRLSKDADLKFQEFIRTLTHDFAGKVPDSVMSIEIKNFIFRLILNNIDGSSYDVIHSQIGLLNPIIRDIYPNIPLVGTVHGCIYSESLNWLPDKRDAVFFREYDAHAVAIPDKVITVSHFLDRNLPPIPKGKHVVIHNGVDISNYQVRPKSNRVIQLVTSGNFHPIKGYDTLLESLISLQNENVPYELTMFGDGPERESYEALVLKHNLRVNFAGLISRKELADRLPKFDVLVQPSRLENFPFSVIEAMGAGCAVLCSNVNGMNEQVSHGENGFLFESGNKQELVKYLRHFALNRADTQKMGMQARRDAEEKFSVAVMADKHERLYQELVESNRAHGVVNQQALGREENTVLVNQEHWDHLYEEMKLYRPVQDDPIRVWINKYIPKTKAKHCIEIGCFPGRFLSVFGDAGYTLHGIDLTPNIEVVPNWLKSFGYSVGEIRRADFFAFDHEACQYDLVSSFGFIEHFTNWCDVLIKHAMMVRQNGYLVLEAPNFASPLHRVIRMFLDNENYKGHNTASMYPHVWAEILSLLGFEICYSGYFGGFQFWLDKQPETQMQQFLAGLVTKSVPFLASLDVPNVNIHSFGGLVARKKTDQRVSERMKQGIAAESIDGIVKSAQAKDRVEEERIGRLLPVFEAWCSYSEGKIINP